MMGMGICTFFLAAFFIVIVIKFLVLVSRSFITPIRGLSHTGFCWIKRIVDGGGKSRWHTRGFLYPH